MQYTCDSHGKYSMKTMCKMFFVSMPRALKQAAVLKMVRC